MAMLALAKRGAQFSVAAGVIGWSMQECLYNVDGGERAVIFDRYVKSIFLFPIIITTAANMTTY